jgi:cytochrome bd-type quinol oxidase subunit 2
MKRMFYYVYCAFLGILFIDVFRSLSFRFRLKYHPEDSVKRKEEQMAALKVTSLSQQVHSRSIYSFFYRKESKCSWS